MTRRKDILTNFMMGVTKPHCIYSICLMMLMNKYYLCESKMKQHFNSVTEDTSNPKGSSRILKNHLDSFSTLASPYGGCFVGSSFEDTLQSKAHTNCIYQYIENCQRNIQNIAQMASTVFGRLGWSFTIIFYDSSISTFHESFLKDINSAGYQHITYDMEKIVNSQEIRQILDYTYNILAERRMNFTIICNAYNMQRILTEANEYDFRPEHFRRKSLRDHSTWYLVTTSSNNVTKFASKLDNVVMLDLSKPKKETHNIFENCNSLNKSLDFQKSYLVYTLMWKRNKDKELIREFEEVGSVSNSGNIHLHSNIQPNLNFGFNGRHFRTTTIWYPPFTNIIYNNGTVHYTGFGMDLLDEFSKKLNFTYSMTSSNEFGMVLDNGSWIGVVGQLARRDVDLAVAALTIRPDRETVMDFTLPFYYDSSTLLMKRPDPNENNLYTFMKPLRMEVFLFIGAALPVSAFLLYIIEYVTPYYKISGTEGKQDFQMSFWYMFGALISQGGESLPNSQSGRTFVSAFWLFSIILVATYNGNLFAFLTVSLETYPFDSLEEMVERTDYKWGFQGGSFYVGWFKNSQLEPLQSVWTGVKKFNVTDPDVLHPDPLVHVEKLYKEKYAFFADKSLLDKLKSNRCELRTASEEIPNNFYGVGLPNNSLYTKIFTNQIIQFYENGILHGLKHKYMPDFKNCTAKDKLKATKVELIDMYSAFYLLAAGLVLAFVVLLAEKQLKRIADSYCRKGQMEPCTLTRSREYPLDLDFVNDNLSTD